MSQVNSRCDWKERSNFQVHLIFLSGIEHNMYVRKLPDLIARNDIPSINNFHYPHMLLRILSARQFGDLC